MQIICPCHTLSNARFLFLETGGTQHISNNATTLSAVQAYYGNNKFLVGDGKHLPISHVGSKLLSTAHTNFKLNNVFHVPNIAAKFISAPNLCHDNNSFFEFHPYYYYIKDQKTRKVLLQGRLEKGLYKFPEKCVQESSPSAIFTTNEDIQESSPRQFLENMKIFKFVMRDWDIQPQEF